MQQTESTRQAFIRGEETPREKDTVQNGEGD